MSVLQFDLMSLSTIKSKKTKQKNNTISNMPRRNKKDHTFLGLINPTTVFNIYSSL